METLQHLLVILGLASLALRRAWPLHKAAGAAFREAIAERRYVDYQVWGTFAQAAAPTALSSSVPT